MKRFFLATIGFACCVLFSFGTKAQCTVEANVSTPQVVCGDCATLVAFGQGQGLQVFSENFNSGVPVGWDTTQQALFTNPCSPTGVDSTTHIWFGNSSGVPRFLTTKPYDFSTATAGVTICFDLLYAVQTGDPATAPCEGPDEPGEGVHLQYSIDGGNTWVDVHYFDPNGGSDPLLINWNNWCFQLPQAALTANTKIRWYQDIDSGADYDHWGLDNVGIYYNDPTYNIVWQHDGYAYGQGSSGGADPKPACPHQTTDYIVVMSNGSQTCRDTVRVTVVNPALEVNAGPDIRVCHDECATIQGTAKVVKYPAKTPTYRNGEVALLAGLPDSASLPGLLLPCLNPSGCQCPDSSTVGFLQLCPLVFTGTLSMNINITDLNTATIQNGQLTSICIEDVTLLFGDLSPFGISLTCPSGSQIILANPGDVTGTSIKNACFDLAATNPIATGSAPYTGSWRPVQPFTNLVGCDANGVWTLTLSGVFDFSTGILPAIGSFNGWSVSFDDPEISYTAELSWNPTTGLSDSNSVHPIVCPTQDINYTLTASDTAGCVTDTDAVSITVDTTDLNVSAVITQPNCGSGNGAIDLAVTGGSNNYTYSWSNGATTQDLNGIAIGVYSVTVNDPAHCSEDTLFNVSSVTGPAINSITATSETCFGLNDGTASVIVSGGTGSITYIWSNGQGGSLVTGLAPGTYNVTVSDALNCASVATTTVNAGGNIIVTEQTTDESCSNACDGAIALTVTGGIGTLNYQWSDGGANTISRSNLCLGTYGFTVSDANNCTETGFADINSLGSLFIDLGPDLSFCEGLDATLDAGAGLQQYNWSTGATTQTITVVQSGDYSVTVSNGTCIASDSVNVNVILAPLVNVNPNDTTIVIGNSVQLNTTVSGSGNYFWTPSTFLTCDDCANPIAFPPTEGTYPYTLTYSDESECSGTDSVTIIVLPENFTPVVPSAFTPNGDQFNNVIRVLPDILDVKEFKVYNRWGQQVSSNPQGWDGNFEGKEQPIGTYTYDAVVELPDGTEKRIKGVFSLLR